MDIDKIHDAMKVLKDECKKYKKCEDCIFNDPQNKSCVLLETDPVRWDEEKIVENNCTTAHIEDLDEWFVPVLRCDNCDEAFMLGGLGLDKEHIVGKFCPHCGKKIVNYKEDKE